MRTSAPAGRGSGPLNLTDALTAYRDRDIYPMHMPGHKRNPQFFALPIPYGIDLTEVDGFDRLHGAEGILAEGMRRAAALYGSRRTFYLINGSTCGILAGISACTRAGDRILMARNCHQSVYHAVGQNRLEAVYLLPEVDGAFGISGSVSPASVARALEQNREIRLIVVTSPTYEGVASDIPAIAALAHAHGVPLLVDEAHGAHLGFSPAFPQNSVSAGADLVIHSLHKTLPSLTQTALLHVNGALVAPEAVQKQLSVFETSSPSYVLMASIDCCIDLLARRGDPLFAAYTSLLWNFSREMKSLKKLRVLCKGTDNVSRHPSIHALDPGKLVISTRNTDLTGPSLFAQLLNRYQIQLEMAAGEYAVAMTSICDTAGGFRRLRDALLALDEALSFGPANPPGEAAALPVSVLPICQAEERSGQFIPLEQSEGRIAREYVYAYPPGIPLLVPGERISARVLDTFASLLRGGVRLHGSGGRIPVEIDVIA